MSDTFCADHMWSMWPWVISTAAGVSRFSSRMRRNGPIDALARVDDDGVGAGPLRQHVTVALQQTGGKSGDQHGSQSPIRLHCGRLTRLAAPTLAWAGTLARLTEPWRHTGRADQRTAT